MHDHNHQATEHKTFSKPDEIREFPRGRVELLRVGSGEVGRLALQPGWRWSNDVKPLAKTDSCEAPHLAAERSRRLGRR